MEVLLNTTWLLVAIGAFLFWQVEGEDNARRREHNRRYRFLALAVALILLFPVISLTDDLHAEQAAMEDSSRSVIKARHMLKECLGAGRSSFMALVPHGPDPAAALRLFQGNVVLIENRSLCLTPIFPHDGRSPPFNV
jgi:hypothetical protein